MSKFGHFESWNVDRTNRDYHSAFLGATRLLRGVGVPDPDLGTQIAAAGVAKRRTYVLDLWGAFCVGTELDFDLR